MKTTRLDTSPQAAATVFPKCAGRLRAAREPQRRRQNPLPCLLALIVLWPLAAALGVEGPPVPGGGGFTNILLNSWSFTDTTNWLSDRGYAPLSFTNLNVSDLGAGTALVLDSPDAAWLQYNVVENDSHTNLTVDQGSVMFWFAPDWAGTNEGGTGPGQWGRLIEVGSYTADARFGWWSLYADPDGVNLYFAAQTNDGSQAIYLSAPIDWTTNRWHLLALTYCATNSALYVDGELATNGLPVTYWPGPDVLANGFWIGSDSNGVAQARGMFDSLKTYANVLDPDFIADTFDYDSFPYYMNPMNIGNLSPAPSGPQMTPYFAAITGSGYLSANVSAVGNCTTNSNVWITNIVATVITNVVPTNGTVNLAFTIWGGSNSLPYDVFATSALRYPITNAVWAWMGQGYSCYRYTLTNLPMTGAWLILGTPQDTDGDGLTDAYELLISHTDPQKADTSGDGMLDGWKVLWGLDLLANNPAQPSKRANFTYYLEGWLDTVSGVRGETVGADIEGNVTGN